MTTVLTFLLLCNLLLLWRMNARNQENSAAVWQALAAQKRLHEALVDATGEALGGIDAKFDEVDSRVDGLDMGELITVARPADCGCAKCRQRAAWRTN